MPRIRALTEAQRQKEQEKERELLEEKAARNFRAQMGALKYASGLSMVQIGEALGIKKSTLADRISDPGSLRKREELALAMLFEKNGLRYDATMGGLWG